MSIRQITREYVIDLQESEEVRWTEVIRKEGKTAKGLIRSATRDFPGYDAASNRPNGWTSTVIGMFSGVYRFSGGRHCGELAAWAQAVGCSAGELTGMSGAPQAAPSLSVHGRMEPLLAIECAEG